MMRQHPPSQWMSPMITRRAAAFGIAGSVVLLRSARLAAEDAPEPFNQLIYPPIEALDNPEPFGYQPATEDEINKAKLISEQTPKGPRPIDIAQSFVDRFYKSELNAISQWPAPSHWNPLIVEFFSATSYHANNDMIAWCAAFANWCLERAGKSGSRSAASQSFLSKDFEATKNPKPGDLAIFTCYDKASGKSLGLGHVTFFKSKISETYINVVGGNQSGDGHSSIISERPFFVADRDVGRHVGNNYVTCTMRLNRYISVT
jgi:uncharacterized protein (TIGR02594 family)